MTSAAPQALAVSRHTNPIGPERGEREREREGGRGGRGGRGREGREGEGGEGGGRRERGERGNEGERRGGRRWEVKEGEVRMEGCRSLLAFLTLTYKILIAII